MYLAETARNSRTQMKTNDTPVKILFLDIDGVLHPLGANNLPKYASLNELSSRVDCDVLNGDDPDYISQVVKGEFMSDNMTELCRIIDNTGAVIVLSSTWRTSSYQYKAAVRELGKIGIKQENFQCTPNFGSISTREVEICSFIRQCSMRIQSYCCLDDADLKDWDEAVFDSSCFVKCDSSKGLTNYDAICAISILNSNLTQY